MDSGNIETSPTQSREVQVAGGFWFPNDAEATKKTGLIGVYSTPVQVFGRDVQEAGTHDQQDFYHVRPDRSVSIYSVHKTIELDGTRRDAYQPNLLPEPVRTDARIEQVDGKPVLVFTETPPPTEKSPS